MGGLGGECLMGKGADTRTIQERLGDINVNAIWSIPIGCRVDHLEVRSPAVLFGETSGSFADCISNPEVGGGTRETLPWLTYPKSWRPYLVTYAYNGRRAAESLLGSTNARAWI